MAQSDDPTRAEEDWTPRKLTVLGLITITVVLFILYRISP
jgi:hypothetical protein